MNSNSSGGRLERFLSGKGFYIVLFLCAAVIGVSAWMMAEGNATMQKDVLQTSVSSEQQRVETVIIPAHPVQEPSPAPEIEAEAPPAPADLPAEAIPADSEDAVPAEAAGPLWTWPLSGEILRAHSADRLSYDVTMRDWRSHQGVDILAEQGAEVCAACAGMVESIYEDDLLGTVVTLSHGVGSRSFYANLEPEPAVHVGQWVEAGQVIGAVGRSALAEVSEEPHLHFAMEVNGSSVDPRDYLPG